MDWLVNHLTAFCLSQGFDKTYWMGYSGGLDSHALLHGLVQVRLQYPLKLKAVHINHQLSSKANDWSIHCANICQALQVDFVAHTLRILPTVKNSFEDLARRERYAVLAKVIQINDFLLTAHHQEDQAETVLLQLLRGAGPKGLAAMPLIKPFSHGFHARPLLTVTREDLRQYATFNQLQWIEDESNTNVNFTRNFLRHDILPLLKKRWPQVTHTLARVARHCGDTQRIVDELMTEDLKGVNGSQLGTLSVKKLLQFDSVRQRHLLRAWLTQQRFPFPSTIKMQSVQQDILNAGWDKMPYCSWQAIELRRYRDDLYAMLCLTPHDVSSVYEWDRQQSIDIAGIGKVESIGVKKGGMRDDIQKVTIRFRQGGETLKLCGRAGHRTLKNLFQEWKVPPWLRDRIPLVYVDEKLAAVVGYAIDEEFISIGEVAGWSPLLREKIIQFA